MSKIAMSRSLSALSLGMALFYTLAPGCKAAFAEQGKLQLHVMKLGNVNLAGIVIGPEGPGGHSFPTNVDGRGTVILPLGTKPNDPVTLQIVSPRNVYVFISPFDKKVTVPSFEDKAENFRSIVLAKPGDRAILQNGQGIVAITATILTTAEEERKKSSNPQAEALDKVSREFGMKKEEVDLAIRSWKDHTSDISEKALVALYEARYAQAAELFSASLKNDEKELRKAQMRVFHDAFFLGVSTYKGRRFSAAAKAFQRAVELDSTNQDALEYLAKSLRESNQLSEAEIAYQRLLSVIGEDDGTRRSEVLLPLGEVLEKNGKLAEAQNVLEEAYESTNNDGEEPQEYTEYLDALGDFLQRHGKFDEAADRYRALFQTYLHPREYPRIDEYSLDKILMIWKKQNKNATAEEVCNFVLDDELPETRAAVLKTIRSLQKDLTRKP